MSSDLTQHWQLFAAAFATVALLSLLGRVPVLGRAIRLAISAALLAILVLGLSQQSRFNPAFSRLAGLMRMDGVDEEVTGAETRVKMAPDGHFWVRASLDGSERRMLIDSGATVTALSNATAIRAGLTIRPSFPPMLVQTANGTIPTATATVHELRIGNVVARDLPVVVSPAFGEMDVIGMNLLSRLASWRVEGRTLILTPHHPQRAKTPA